MLEQEIEISEDGNIDNIAIKRIIRYIKVSMNIKNKLKISNL